MHVLFLCSWVVCPNKLGLRVFKICSGAIEIFVHLGCGVTSVGDLHPTFHLQGLSVVVVSTLEGKTITFL
jgi:hypothetical protein